MNEFEIGTVGCRLTSMDMHYRSKWLETVYICIYLNYILKICFSKDVESRFDLIQVYVTLHMLNANDYDALDSAITSDAQLYSTIRVRY